MQGTYRSCLASVFGRRAGGWSRAAFSVCLLLLCAHSLPAQGVITDVFPSQVAQGYPLNASTFQITVYFNPGFGGVPETARWVNAPGGAQTLPFSSTPSDFYATLTVPAAMTANLGMQQIQICRGEGSVCSIVADSTKLEVVRPQVVGIDPATVTRGVGDQNIYLQYILPRSDAPMEPPTVFIVNSDGSESPHKLFFDLEFLLLVNNY